MAATPYVLKIWCSASGDGTRRAGPEGSQGVRCSVRAERLRSIGVAPNEFVVYRGRPRILMGRPRPTGGMAPADTAVFSIGYSDGSAGTHVARRVRSAMAPPGRHGRHHPR